MSTSRNPEELRLLALTMTRELGRRVSAQELRRRTGGGAPFDQTIEGLIRDGLVARRTPGEVGPDGLGGPGTPGGAPHPGAEAHYPDRAPHPGAGAHYPDRAPHPGAGAHYPDRAPHPRIEDQLQRLAGRAERWIRNLAAGDGQEITEAEAIRMHIDQTDRKATRELAGLRGHTVSFLGVNTMLFVIWALTGAGFPWFLIPLAGWGIGYASHRAEVLARIAENREVQKLTRPNLKQLGVHRKLWKKRRGFRGHLVSTAMVSVLLGTINIITGGGFAWALIPIAGMGIGVFAHYGTFRGEERRLVEELDYAASSPGPLPSVTGVPDGTLPPAQQAVELRDRIVAQIEAFPVSSSLFDHDFHASLDAYVKQVTQLAGTSDELSAAIGSIPVHELDTDRARLVERRSAAANPRMQAEYDRSIEQIDRQKQSYAELAAEQEMVELKIGNAVNALRQLQIDVTRMKSMTPAQGEEALVNLRNRTSDLGQYLRDLSKGYDDLE